MLIKKALRILWNDGPVELLRQIDNRYRPQALEPRFGLGETLRRSSILFGHLKYRVLWPINQSFHKTVYPIESGVDVMQNDWDTLVLLDACRPDMFRAANDIEGTLSTTWSRGGRSYTFVQRNFDGKELHDTVYVCANIHFSKLSDDIFHGVIQVWDYAWDDDVDTIPPEAVTAAALDAAERYPEKQLIVHYMQPHTPFLGENAVDVLSETSHPELSHLDGYSVLGALKHGLIDIDDSTLFDMYVENTEVVLQDVAELVDELDGKTVISADHGELVGERLGPIPMRYYGHGPHLCNELREVPWFVVGSEDRRTVTADPPVETRESDTEDTQERLEALGYV